jgi:phage gp46-like protein
MSDVLLRQEDDGGNVEVVGGLMTMTDSHEVAAYLSMFGGNEQDSGATDGERKQWWGNLTETNTARRYRSETQHLLQSLPAVPANLRRVQDAAEHDLAWFVEERIATLVAVSASMPGINRIQLDVRIDIDGVEHRITVKKHWSEQQR